MNTMDQERSMLLLVVSHGHHDPIMMMKNAGGAGAAAVSIIMYQYLSVSCHWLCKIMSIEQNHTISILLSL